MTHAPPSPPALAPGRCRHRFVTGAAALAALAALLLMHGIDATPLTSATGEPAGAVAESAKAHTSGHTPESDGDDRPAHPPTGHAAAMCLAILVAAVSFGSVRRALGSIRLAWRVCASRVRPFLRLAPGRGVESRAGPRVEMLCVLTC